MAACAIARLVSESPEVVKAQHALDGASRILSNYWTNKLHRGHALACGRHKGHSEFPVAPINRNGSQRRKRHALSAHRSLIVGVARALGKENEVWVGVQKFLPALWIVSYPLLDALHAHFITRQSRIFNQPGAQASVGMPILIRVADTKERTVVKQHAPGSLDLQKERLHGVVGPADHMLFLQILARGDALAIVVRN